MVDCWIIHDRAIECLIHKIFRAGLDRPQETYSALPIHALNTFAYLGPTMKNSTAKRLRLSGLLAVLFAGSNCGLTPTGSFVAAGDPTEDVKKEIAKLNVGELDWPQWGGGPARNNTPDGTNIPTRWDTDTGENIRWSQTLGSETYGNPVVANGKVYVGTNNAAGYLDRYPKNVDLGVLLCLNESDGSFIWQHSLEKLPTGATHDWPSMGICSAPLVDGDRLWLVTSRGTIDCLDTEGFQDDENDGPFVDEESKAQGESDIVWRIDMMKEFDVSQHNMCSCSVTGAEDYLFVLTGNGVDDSHERLPSESAPSFLCVRRSTGEILWTDNTPGANVLHGQWASPAYAEIGGRKQVLFPGGDGWLYSFSADGLNGQSELLWKFDCNPKDSVYSISGRGTRNHLIGTPVVCDDRVYIAVGEDPEYGEGDGHLWCIDPTGSGDVSPTLVYNNSNPEQPIPHKKLQALVEADGDFERDNPNSKAVWHYVGNDPDEFEQKMHRTCGTACVKNDLVFIADFSGMLHCVDAKTGVAHWTYDMFAASWASPLIVENKVYVGDEDGDIAVFDLSPNQELIEEFNIGFPSYTTPIVANNTIFVAGRSRIFAIEQGASSSAE